MSTLPHAFAPVHSTPEPEPARVPLHLYEVQCEELADLYREESAWLAEQLGDFDAPFAGEPELPFAEWVEAQASYFRSLGTAAGDWLAAEVDELASLARFFRADTPDELFGRRYLADLDALRAERLDAWQEGFDEAKSLYRQPPRCSFGGHDA